MEPIISGFSDMRLFKVVPLLGLHLPCGELNAGSDIPFQSWISDFIQVLKIQ